MNAAGSGKTRLVIDGLSTRYGFYLTSIVDSGVLGSLGSTDLHDILHETLAATPGFKKDISSLTDQTSFTHAEERNRSIAEKHFQCVLLARILIFRKYRKLASPNAPWGSLESKRRWLMVQLLPSLLLHDTDIFKGLTTLLFTFSKPVLVNIMEMGVQVMMRSLKEAEPSESKQKMYCVLDEAQKAAASFLKAFPSRTTPGIYRPVLTEIVFAWSTLDTTNSSLIFVVTGTSLDVPTMSNALATTAHKIDIFKEYNDTGGFDDKDAQTDYISRYLPRSAILLQEEYDDLFERAYVWLRGR